MTERTGQTMTLTTDQREMIANALALYAAHHRRNAPDPARAEDSYRQHMQLAASATALADEMRQS